VWVPGVTMTVTIVGFVSFLPSTQTVAGGRPGSQPILRVAVFAAFGGFGWVGVLVVVDGLSGVVSGVFSGVFSGTFSGALAFGSLTRASLTACAASPEKVIGALSVT